MSHMSSRMDWKLHNSQATIQRLKSAGSGIVLEMTPSGRQIVEELVAGGYKRSLPEHRFQMYVALIGLLQDYVDEHPRLSNEVHRIRQEFRNNGVDEHAQFADALSNKHWNPVGREFLDKNEYGKTVLEDLNTLLKSSLSPNGIREDLGFALARLFDTVRGVEGYGIEEAMNIVNELYAAGSTKFVELISPVSGSKRTGVHLSASFERTWNHVTAVLADFSSEGAALPLEMVIEIGREFLIHDLEQPVETMVQEEAV